MENDLNLYPNLIQDNCFLEMGILREIPITSVNANGYTKNYVGPVEFARAIREADLFPYGLENGLIYNVVKEEYIPPEVLFPGKNNSKIMSRFESAIKQLWGIPRVYANNEDLVNSCGETARIIREGFKKSEKDFRQDMHPDILETEIILGNGSKDDFELFLRTFYNPEVYYKTPSDYENYIQYALEHESFHYDQCIEGLKSLFGEDIPEKMMPTYSVSIIWVKDTLGNPCLNIIPRLNCTTAIFVMFHQGEISIDQFKTFLEIAYIMPEDASMGDKELMKALS